MSTNGRHGSRLYRPTAEKVALKLDRHPLDLWPDIVEVDEGWRRRAVCKNTLGRYHLAEDVRPSEVPTLSAWELSQRRKEVAKLKAQARQMCEACPVRLECLDWVLHNVSDSTDVGIWARTTRNQRIRMRKALQVKVA